MQGAHTVLTVLGIDHIVLRTARMTAMMHFYCIVLGCTVEREDSALGLVQLRAGNALIDLITADGVLGKKGGGIPRAEDGMLDHFCLQIAPVDEAALRAHFAAFGVVIGDFARRYGATGYGDSVYIADPEGNTVELRPHRM